MSSYYAPEAKKGVRVVSAGGFGVQKQNAGGKAQILVLFYYSFVFVNIVGNRTRIRGIESWHVIAQEPVLR